MTADLEKKPMKLIDFLALFEGDSLSWDDIHDAANALLDQAGGGGHGCYDLVEVADFAEDLLIMIRAGAFEDYRPGGGP